MCLGSRLSINNVILLEIWHTQLKKLNAILKLICGHFDEIRLQKHNPGLL